MIPILNFDADVAHLAFSLCLHVFRTIYLALR